MTGIGRAIIKPLTFTILSGLILFPYTASAEYYFVREDCWDDCPRAVKVAKSVCHYPIKKKIIKKKIKHKKPVYCMPRPHHRVHKKVRRAPCVTLDHVSSCGVCDEVFIQGRWDCYAPYAQYYVPWVMREPYRYERHRVNYVYYPHDEITYNPDRTTGDDDTWVNPDMNIDE